MSIERIGDTILHRGYDENGKAFAIRENFKPTLFVTTNSTEPKYRTIFEEPLAPMRFESISEAKKFTERYSKVENFKFYGMDSWPISFIEEKYPGSIQYNPKSLRIGYIDIETDSSTGFPEPRLAEKPITAITFHISNRYYVFGCGDYSPHLPNITYRRFDNEIQLLQVFVVVWQNSGMDIVTGWNSEGYDIPYLVNRIRKLLGEDWVRKLSPWGIIKKKVIPTLRGNDIETYDLIGLNHLDYLLLYKRFSGKAQQSYRLGYIAKEELEIEKVDFAEYETLGRLYQEDFQKYLEYNLRDVEILLRLEEKTHLLELAMTLAYTAKTNFIDIFKQTRMWDSIIYNKLKQKGKIIPQRNRSSKDEAFIGAYVKEPISGMYDWVVTLDVTSMYPSLFRAYNIGSDTLMGEIQLNLDDLVAGKPHGQENLLKDKNLAMAANGTLYRKDMLGFSAEILGEAFEERQVYKKKMIQEEIHLEEVHREMSKRGLTYKD